MQKLKGWQYGLFTGVFLAITGSVIEGLWSENWDEVYRSLLIRAAIIIPVFMLIFSAIGTRTWSKPQ